MGDLLQCKWSLEKEVILIYGKRVRRHSQLETNSMKHQLDDKRHSRIRNFRYVIGKKLKRLIFSNRSPKSIALIFHDRDLTSVWRKWGLHCRCRLEFRTRDTASLERSQVWSLKIFKQSRFDVQSLEMLKAIIMESYRYLTHTMTRQYSKDKDTKYNNCFLLQNMKQQMAVKFITGELWYRDKISERYCRFDVTRSILQSSEYFWWVRSRIYEKDLQKCKRQN